MNFKIFLLLSTVGFVLQGCTSVKTLTSDSFKQYTSAQDVIYKKNINENNSSAKEYVYDWGSKQHDQVIQKQIPKNYLNSFCIAKGGQFSQVQKSSMHLIKDIWSKKLLNTYSNVKHGIGTYQCVQSNGEQWYVSIEPLSERKLEQGETRVVNLQTKVLSLDEIKKMYGKATTVAAPQDKKVVTNTPKKPVPNNVTKAEIKVLEEKKPIIPPIEEEEKEKAQPEKVVSTPQNQQMKLYATARKDLGRGQNQINACNNAERAYNYGKLYGSTGMNVYAESGVLVAKCLTSVPSYSRRFSNPQDRAKRILQNIAAGQNHAVAKYMLKQMK